MFLKIHVVWIQDTATVAVSRRVSPERLDAGVTGIDGVTKEGMYVLIYRVTGKVITPN